MELILNGRALKLNRNRLIYLTIIASYILYLGLDLNYNTAFVDEAIYATVGEAILRKIYWESAISWMGGYYIYPLIAANINHYLGLTGIRLFSTICLVVTAVLAGKIARQFASNIGEIVTVLVLLFWANSLNLGQMGTYDAPSLAFLAISVYLAIRSRYENVENRKIVFLLLSSAAFILSILIKYVAILFSPALILLVYNPIPRKKLSDLFNLKAILELLVWGLPIVGVLCLYVGFYLNDLLSFFVGGHSLQPTTINELLHNTWNSMNIILIGSAAAFTYALKFRNGEKRWLALALIVGGTAPLAYHFASINIRSYWKHMVFSAFFLTPLFSWMVAEIYKTTRKYGEGSPYANNLTQIVFSFITIALATSLWVSFRNHWKFQRSWPSITPSVEYLSQHREPEDKILAEAAAVYKYHMFTGFEDPASWPSTWYMEYEGKYGTDAMIAAIEDQYYDFVILNDYFTKSVNDQIRPHLNEYYEIVFEDDYQIEGVYSQNTVVWAPRQSLTTNR